MALLEVDELRAGYGFPVLMGISFEVNEGETAVLFGLNGAGKTTTLSAIAGLLKPDGGAIRFDGRRVDGWSPRQLGRALMSRPRLLLIDEASLGLSPALATIVFEVVARINDDGVTVVIVEQNVGVLPYADRALIMEKGTLVFSGVGDEIRHADLRRT